MKDKRFVMTAHACIKSICNVQRLSPLQVVKYSKTTEEKTKYVYNQASSFYRAAAHNMFLFLAPFCVKSITSVQENSRLSAVSELLKQNAKPST